MQTTPPTSSHVEVGCVGSRRLCGSFLGTLRPAFRAHTGSISGEVVPAFRAVPLGMTAPSTQRSTDEGKSRIPAEKGRNRPGRSGDFRITHVDGNGMRLRCLNFIAESKASPRIGDRWPNRLTRLPAIKPNDTFGEYQTRSSIRQRRGRKVTAKERCPAPR